MVKKKNWRACGVMIGRGETSHSINFVDKVGSNCSDVNS